jgi:serine/threonine protein kinase/tetratricopeptide (TPR) repeat protein
MNQKAESTTAGIKANPERWQRLKNILADALEQTSFEKRTAVLRQSCGDDIELFREAEKLLAHDTTALEEFAELAATRLRDDERDRIGRRIGAYAIVKELGRGGMGAVYLAERADGQFEKQVAIKVIKRGTDTDEVLHRFRIERQILANLDHPNITRLLDAGITNDGLPYFVMEFVEGTAITHFVQQENVDLRSRLELFLKVCSAVAFAHRNQIIHRDIKPTNVVVKRDGEPKLLDFGIAKVLDINTKDGDTTVAAERRLTPLYASPEQNAGQPATMASDVYSLGALLYELLTAQPPAYDSDSNPAPDVNVEHSVTPPIPSRIAADPKTKQQLQGQLDQIVATAMHRDPAQRYSSAAGLFEDIERYLNGAAPRTHHLPTPTGAAERGSRNLNRAASWPRRCYVTAAALAAVVIAAAVLLPRLRVSSFEKYEIRSAPPATSPLNATDAVRSIAVLPFEPLGQDRNDELLGLGMSDAVIGRMSYLKQLVVLPTSAVSKYKGPANDPLAAGRALGVDAILTGTVQRSGKQLRATVQLVDVRDGHTVWSGKFDRTFTDIFSIQDSISESVTRSLALDLTADEQKQLRKHYTTDAAAYDSYLMGLYFWRQRSKNDLEKAINYFQQAVEKDSNFALAYALMADCYYLQVFYRYSAASETVGNAEAAAERALLLDDSVAEAHVAKAMVHSLRKEARLTMESLRRALELNPNLAIAHLRYAWCLSFFGRLNDSVREMKRAQELDPLSPTNNTALGMILIYARQFPASLDYCYKAADLAPNDALIQENLAIAYALNGMYEQAIEHYQRVAELNPAKKGDALAWVATVLVSAGRKPEADSMIPEILDLATAGKADPYNIAVLYATRGEKKPSFEWFAKALETDRMLDPLIRYDPQLDSVRSDSRFAALLRQHQRGSLLESR